MEELKKTLEDVQKKADGFLQTEIDKHKSLLEEEYNSMKKKLEEDISIKKEDLEFEKKNINKVKEKVLKQFLDEQNKIKEEASRKHEIITLNVGGRKFTTTRHTLTKYKGSMLYAMVNGNFKENEDNEIFIDRDGELFAYILTYLRNGEFVMPKDPRLRYLIQKEIEYYAIDGLTMHDDLSFGYHNSFNYEKYYLDEFNEIRTRENKYRKMFVEDRNNLELDNIPLINLFAERNNLVVFPNPYSSCVMIDSSNSVPEYKTPIVNRDEFLARWISYTDNIFDGLCWDNIIVAGGSVLSCLLGKEFGNDIDMFIIASGQKSARNTIMRIYNHILNSGFVNDPKTDLFWIRTEHALTFTLEYPNRHIQVVLRLYKNPAEVLHTFDLDSSCVYFDGSNVFGSERFVHALRYQTNVVDPTRQSKTYEMRLYKYTRRGFSISVPGYCAENINPNVNLRNFWSTNGIKRLLIMKRYEELTGDGMNVLRCECEYINERIPSNRGRVNLEIYCKPCKRHSEFYGKDKLLKYYGGNYDNRYDDHQRKWKFQYETYYQRLVTADVRSLVRIENVEDKHIYEVETQIVPSDYCSEFIPYGRSWNPDDLKELFEKRLQGLVHKKKLIPFLFLYDVHDEPNEYRIYLFDYNYSLTRPIDENYEPPDLNNDDSSDNDSTDDDSNNIPEGYYRPEFVLSYTRDKPFDIKHPNLSIPQELTFEEPDPEKNMRGSFQPTKFDWYGDALTRDIEIL